MRTYDGWHCPRCKGHLEPVDPPVFDDGAELPEYDVHVRCKKCDAEYTETFTVSTLTARSDDNTTYKPAA